MKRNFGVIRMLMLGLALLLSFTDQAKASGGGHGGLTGSVDGYKVALSFKAGQAQIGHNQLIVRLHDQQDQPVGNAKVTVVVRKYTGAEKATADHGSSGADMGKENHADPGKSAPKKADVHGSSGTDMGKENHADPGKSAPEKADVHGSSGADMGKEDHAGAGKSIPEKADVHGSSGMDMNNEENAGHGPSDTDQYGSPVTVALAASHDIGEYVGEAETAEAGQWMIKVMFGAPQKERSVVFMVDVEKGGPNWPVLWGFLVVNVAIIAVAAMTRKKSVSSPVPEEVV